MWAELLKKLNTEALKQAVVAICIGTFVSFLTQLLQTGVHWLQGIDPGTVGGVGGGVSYLAQKIRTLV